MLQKLKSEVKQWIKDDQELQLKIAKVFSKKNIVTVQRWLKSDNVILTHPMVLEIIREHKNLKKKEELTEVVSDGKAIAR
jgi:hypothetical protein